MTDLLSRRDLAFQLHELHRLDEVLSWPMFAEHDAATCDTILDAAFRLAHAEFLPSAAKLDAEEPHFDGQRVRQPAECKRAIDAYIAGGFLSAPFPAALGGLQIPSLLASAIGPLFTAANAGAAGYVFLTAAAANLLRAHGSDAQKALFLPPMLEGRWFGTMCLSEPQAGSSLADIKTRATPRADGSYDIRGNKMWISGGEHALSENIVQLVLAKIDGAPAGVKGISLFIVPKFRVGADGAIGERNGIRLIGLNHKMGNRGTTNCALSFGDGEDCIGQLIGEPHRGLQYMFHMMNEARIGVGLGAVALGYAGYRHSLDYAKNRPQGRPIGTKDPASAPVPIIEHADVRRMLLQQKVYVEGGLALGLMGARLVDEHAAHPEEKSRADAGALLDLLTPIIKAWPSEFCLRANELAIQVLGGYGYTRDYPVERLYRDNRLNPIHEGTNGIQGLDLLGRKVLGDGGKALRLLAKRMQQSIERSNGLPFLTSKAAELKHALSRVIEVTAQLGATAASGNSELAMCHSNAYLEMFGHLVVAWLWLDQARIALAAMPAAEGDEHAFYAGKFAAFEHFYLYELPKIGMLADILKQQDRGLLDLQIEGL
jgi:butyryl-CoA dehydrogenase